MVSSISGEERSARAEQDPCCRQKVIGSQQSKEEYVSSAHKVHPIRSIGLGQWHNSISLETCPKENLQEIISTLGFTHLL